MSSERLDPAAWMPQAQGLGPGKRKRGDHDCGDPGTLLITHNSDGSKSAYCFRCGAKGYHQEQLSLAQRLELDAKRAKAEQEVRATLDLPSPRVRNPAEWPAVHKLWFYKMGFTLDMMRRFGVYYAPALDRVVIPMSEDGAIVYWQARTHDTSRPKWINPHVDKGSLNVRYGIGKGDTIVLTEDAPSAFKVSHVTEAWPMLGTKLSPLVMMRLIESGKRVAVWLDDDKGRRNGANPGQEAAAVILKALRAHGVDVRNVTSDKDPKQYNPRDIEEILHGH